MQTGVSYFSSRTLRHVGADLQEIVEHGCTYVVHCFTESDLAYYRDTMHDVARATHDAGLEVWFDPWGLVGIFSGETFTRFPLEHPDTWQVLSDGRRAPAACPNNPETRAFREASLLDLLSELSRYGHEKGLANALCLLPTDLAAHGFPQQQERLQRALERRLQDAPAGAIEAMLHVGVGDFDTAAAIPDLDIFGCDPYWYLFGTDAEAFMRSYGEAAAVASRNDNSGLQLWVQAFSVPAGREDELRTGLRVAAELNATHVAAWSFEATASM